MEYFAILSSAIYAAFITGGFIQQQKAHKKWENEMKPLIRENERLK